MKCSQKMNIQTEKSTLDWSQLFCYGSHDICNGEKWYDVLVHPVKMHINLTDFMQNFAYFCHFEGKFHQKHCINIIIRLDTVKNRNLNWVLWCAADQWHCLLFLWLVLNQRFSCNSFFALLHFTIDSFRWIIWQIVQFICRIKTYTNNHTSNDLIFPLKIK